MQLKSRLQSCIILLVFLDQVPKILDGFPRLIPGQVQSRVFQRGPASVRSGSCPPHTVVPFKGLVEFLLLLQRVCVGKGPLRPRRVPWIMFQEVLEFGSPFSEWSLLSCFHPRLQNRITQKGLPPVEYRQQGFAFAAMARLDQQAGLQVGQTVQPKELRMVLLMLRQQIQGGFRIPGSPGGANTWHRVLGGDGDKKQEQETDDLKHTSIIGIRPTPGGESAHILKCVRGPQCCLSGINPMEHSRKGDGLSDVL